MTRRPESHDTPPDLEGAPGSDGAHDVGGVPDVVGRRREREQLDAFVGAVPAGIGALVITGEAGIGKTVLWHRGVASCREAGYEVLVARPSEDEMSGALIGLVDLFERIDDDRVVLGGDVDPFIRGRAILDALRSLATQRPVVLAIDDVQWLDVASAKCLRYALRRLDTEPVGVLATMRPGDGGGDRLALTDSLPPGRTATLRIGPLEEADVRLLLAGIVTSISPLTLRKIHLAAAGNPLYAVELARSLASAGASPTAGGLSLPDSLQGAIEQRLETLPAELTPLLEVVAATGATRYEEAKKALPGADLHGLLTEADELGVLRLNEDLRVRFAHPLFASAVYSGIGVLERRRLHAKLAELAGDDDIRARHLALSSDAPDEEAAALLGAAAERARSRGASDAAAEFAHHAARLTPENDAAAKSRRALAEVTDLAAAGEVSRALALVDRLVASLPSGPRRAEALVQRFYVESDDIARADATLVRALNEADGDEPLRGRVLDILGWLRGVFHGDLRAGIACTQEAVEIAERHGDDRLWMQAAAHDAHMKALTGRPDPATMAHAVQVADELGSPRLGGGPRAWMAKQLLWAGDLPAATALLGEVVTGHIDAGNELERPYRRYDQALLCCTSGDLAKAWYHVEDGIRSARDAENLDAEGWMLYPKALAAAWLGDTAVAREAVDDLISWRSRPGSSLGRARAYSALGMLSLSEGDCDSAAATLVAATELLDEIGIAHPGALPVLPDAVVALAGCGRLDDAEALCARMHEQAKTLDLERVWAMYDHAAGALALARGDAHAAVERLTASIETCDRLGLAPEAARAELALGQALLRAGRRTQAAEALGSARSRFGHIGAPRWHARAAAELERAQPGGTTGTLTPAEARIAELVAAGAKNKEIAATLFMSNATVEAHLTRTYRKLGIRSRTELARLVVEGAVALSPPSGAS